jgi:hypothetical protein
VLVFAIDMTEDEETRDTLRRHVEAHDETLNHLADAGPSSGPSRRLAPAHNTAFQTLFSPSTRPGWPGGRLCSCWDRLRQRRMLQKSSTAGWRPNWSST